MGLLTPVEQEAQKTFGMVPMEERLSILPRYSSTQGLIAPQFIYDLAKAFVSPYVAMQGRQVSPEESLNVAMSAMGGSSIGSAPKGALRSGFLKDQGSIKPTGLLQPVKPEINMQIDSANRFVFKENKNPDIVLTTSSDQFDPKYMNAYLEVIGDPKKVGGKGTATRLYIEALDVAKKNNMGWKSDTVTSGATQKMYERLTNMGIPFQKVDNQFVLSPEQLSRINLPNK